MASLAILVMPISTLVATALVIMTEVGRGAMSNPGPHGFTEVRYAFTSMANNNGSAFAGLNANSPLYNVIGALVMLLGRFWITIPILALAGSFADKRVVHVSEGALPTHTPLFAVWLMIVTVVVSAMSFFPALALGPIAEHLLMAG